MWHMFRNSFPFGSQSEGWTLGHSHRSGVRKQVRFDALEQYCERTVSAAFALNSLNEQGLFSVQLPRNLSVKSLKYSFLSFTTIQGAMEHEQALSSWTTASVKRVLQSFENNKTWKQKHFLRRKCTPVFTLVFMQNISIPRGSLVLGIRPAVRNEEKIHTTDIVKTCNLPT